VTAHSSSGALTQPTSLLASPRRRRRVGPGLGFWWVVPAVIFLAVFFVAPLLDNAVNSALLQQAGQRGLSFEYYEKLVGDAYYLTVILRTLVVSLIVTAICLVVGYPIAYFMVRHAGRWNGLIIFLLVAPLLTPIIMRTFGWRVLFARKGLANNLLVDLGIIAQPLKILQEPSSVIIGLVHVLVPFMVLSIASVLQGIDTRLEESARILGAGKLQTFMRITLPLSLDGVGTGAILVFMLTNGSFVTMLLLGGGSVVTLPLLIYQQFNLVQNVGFAAAMGNLLLAFALACLYLQLRLIRRRGVRR
jgi:putative spermidine/putrescine transport system permease protein